MLMSLQYFQIFVAVVTVLGFLMGYFAVSPITGITGAIVPGLLGAALCGGFFAFYLDNQVSSESTILTPVSLTVVDTFAGTNILGNDLTVKLSDGRIVHYSDPYVWKQFSPGSLYNCTKYERISYLNGNSSRIDYTYIGVI